MGAQRGRDLVLRLDESGAGSFVTVAGLRARRLSFNADAVDVTDTESAGRWRELLDGAGVRRASLSGSGIFKDASSDAAARTIFFAGAIRSWQVVIPDFGTVSGPFQLTGLDYAGNHDGEVTYEISLESAGELAFAAA
ncbi:phage major tail protein, TP901-1 family [Amorphus sp. MBR-141]